MKTAMFQNLSPCSIHSNESITNNIFSVEGFGSGDQCHIRLKTGEVFIARIKKSSPFELELIEDDRNPCVEACIAFMDYFSLWSEKKSDSARSRVNNTISQINVQSQAEAEKVQVKVNKAAITIQQAYRVYLNNKKNKAATTIQQAYRVYLNNKKNKAATTIQQAYRVYLNNKKNKAATTIQQAYRVYLNNKKNKAATTIQQAYRVYLNKKNIAATIIQQAYRVHLNKQNKAATVIQRFFRKFLDVIVKDSNTSTSGLCILTGGKSDFAKEQMRYFFDPKRKLPPYRTPKDKLDKKWQDKGGYKKLIAEDDDFVALEMFPSHQLSTQQQMDMNTIARALIKYTSFSPCIAISDSLIIAKNEGICLNFHLRVNKEITIFPFESICKDLADAHKNLIFHRDISLENITIFKNTLKLIDTEDVALPELNNYSLLCGKQQYATVELMHGKTQGSKEMLRAADDYALLVTMMLATTADIKLPKTSQQHPIPMNSIYYGQSLKVCSWLTVAIKANYYSCVLDFVKSPSKNPLDISIHEAINWKEISKTYKQ